MIILKILGYSVYLFTMLFVMAKAIPALLDDEFIGYVYGFVFIVMCVSIYFYSMHSRMQYVLS